MTTLASRFLRVALIFPSPSTLWYMILKKKKVYHLCLKGEGYGSYQWLLLGLVGYDNSYPVDQRPNMAVVSMTSFVYSDYTFKDRGNDIQVV